MKFPEIAAILIQTATENLANYKFATGADDIIFDSLAQNLVAFWGDPELDPEEILSFGKLRANIWKGMDHKESTRLFLEDFASE